jgi:hypothetical protein
MKFLMMAAITVALAGLAAALGFAAAVALLTVWGWAFPFREEWDDTWHELLPVGLAYLTWALTSVVLFLLGVRFARGRLGISPGSRDIR